MEPTATTGRIAQHTPGPWRAGTWGALQEHAVVVIDQWDEQVADTSDLLKDWAICEANARLIATAPDLLAACNALTARLHALVTSGDCGNWSIEDEDSYMAAIAAIAKAEGRQS